MFGIQAFNTVKTLSGHTVKVHVWCSGLTAAMFHLFGPEEFGGKGDVRTRAEEEARQTGASSADIILQVRSPIAIAACLFPNNSFQEYVGTKGEVVRVPGMPPMYDYEYYPQPVSALATVCSSWSNHSSFYSPTFHHKWLSGSSLAFTSMCFA